MTVGANQFDTIEVKLSQQTLKALGSNRKRRQEVEDNTRALVEYVLQPSLSEQDLGEFSLDRVDPHAIITLSHRAGRGTAGGVPKQAPLLDILLTYGRSAPVVIAALLAHQEDPNRPYHHPNSRIPKQPDSLMWQAYHHVDTIDYLSAFIADARVDVEQPFSITRQSLLFSLCERMIMPTSSPSGVFRPPVEALLRRDALLDPVFGSECSPLLRHEQVDEGRKQAVREMQREVLAPFIASWKKEWDAVMQGDIMPSDISHQQFRHFFSLGKLEEMLTHPHWYGQEQQLWNHYQNLPDWAKARYPVPDVLEQLLARIQPNPDYLVEVPAMQGRLHLPDRRAKE